MNRLVKAAIAVVGLAALYGCPSVNIEGGQTRVFQVRTLYTAALTAAVEYESLPRCEQTELTLCSDTSVVAEIRNADLSAKAALDGAESFVRTHPELDASSAITAAVSAVETFKQILEIYSISVEEK